MKKKLPIYIVWILFNNRYTYFSAHSCLKEATSFSNKFLNRDILSKVTEHWLELENILETTDGDLIKNLNL